MGVHLGAANSGEYSDGERSFKLDELVSGSKVFVMQSKTRDVDRDLMELLIMIRVTIIPNLTYFEIL